MDNSVGILAGKVILLFVAYVLSIGIGVFLHELGHTLAALLLTKQDVRLCIGYPPSRRSLKWGRLELFLGVRNFRYGSTSYERSMEGIGKQIVVAAAGPLASLVALFLSVWVLWGVSLEHFRALFALAFFVANFRILIVALWPIEYLPDQAEGERWVSDGLDVWRMVRGGKGAEK